MTLICGVPTTTLMRPQKTRGRTLLRAAWMPSTRSGQEPKNQRAAAEAESEASASNDFVAPPSPAPVVAPSPVMKSASNGAPVVMMVTGHWNPPPGIGEIEMILRSSSRMQHRIMRIEVRAECAFVEVHPQDVAVCTGVFELGGVQVRNSRACTSCHAARPTTPPNCALLTPGARRPSLRVPWSSRAPASARTASIWFHSATSLTHLCHALLAAAFGTRGRGRGQHPDERTADALACQARVAA